MKKVFIVLVLYNLSVLLTLFSSPLFAQSYTTPGFSTGQWDVKFTESNISNDTQFGYDAINVGDVNGDDFDDILVSAQRYDFYCGRVFLYYGGSPMDTVADVIFYGKTRERLGCSIAAVGDLNKDGYNDFLIGTMPLNFEKSHFYIHLGGPYMDNKPDVVMYGKKHFDEFGTYINGGGDVNNDGYDDILVAMPRSNLPDQLYIYYGSAEMDTTVDMILDLENDKDLDYHTSSLTWAGDLNNDGYDDIMISEPSYNFSRSIVYILYGGTALDGESDIVLKGSRRFETYFGSSVAALGDINQDGYDDLLVGESGYNDRSGRALLYLGGAVMDSIPDMSFSRNVADIQFGSSVTGAGDVNNDGYNDFLIGAPGYDQNTGRAYLYHGGPELDNNPDIVFFGKKAGCLFSRCLCGVGDVNNDGYNDLLAGGQEYTGGGGPLYIYYGGRITDIFADVVLTDKPSNNCFAYSISGIGDNNGDGYDDLLAGAPGYNDRDGRAYLYYGGQNNNTNADISFSAIAREIIWGSQVAGAGDLNGDNFSDYIIGTNDYINDTGQAFLFFGAAEPDTVADIKLTRQENYYKFCSSFANAGDINNDGYSDLLVGNSHYNDFTGRVYLYFGGVTMDSIADFTLDGEKTTRQKFGKRVAGAGDVNKDGYDDILIASENNGNYSSSVNLYFGGLTLNSTPALVFTESNYSSFSCTIAGAGDVNGDGYDDILAGTYTYHYLTSSGRAYLYFGGANMDSVADVIFTGDSQFSRFGNSVTGIGDVNNDGFADVLIGADEDTLDTGRAYLYYGGEEMDNVPDEILVGEAKGDKFGYCVAAARDVNSDGISDFIIGAPHNGDYYNGAMYLYYGHSTTAINDTNPITMSQPNKAQLQNNYPNPFNPTTTIEFDLPERAIVEIVIYDISGRTVRALLHESRPGGQHRLTWDGRNDSGAPVGSGVYLCKFSTDKGYSATKRMTLVK